MQRYFSNNLKDNYFVLSDEDKHHIFNVMRMSVQDKIEVVYNNELYICILDEYGFKMLEKVNVYKINKPYVHLVVPILKEAKMDIILQKSTELGVDEITVVNTERTIVKASGKEEKKLNRWNKIAKEASEQSKRLDIPKINGVNDLKSVCNVDGLKVVCSTDIKSESFKNLLQNNEGCAKITLVIGPEGGLSNTEEANLVKFGFNKVSFGNFVLRSETVPIYLLSIINYISME